MAEPCERCGADAQEMGSGSDGQGSWRWLWCDKGHVAKVAVVEADQPQLW